MTLKIKLSSLMIPAEEFARRVAAHVVAMKEYAAHLEGVNLDAANPDLKPEERRVAFPGPSEEPLIEVAAREDYEFEGPTLDEKKAALNAEVRRVEGAAIEHAVPSAKRRHWQFREADIRAADHKRLIDHPQRVDDVEAFHATNRPAEDTQFLAEHAARHAKATDIARWAAKHEHDIADLNETNVDHYVIGGAFA